MHRGVTRQILQLSSNDMVTKTMDNNDPLTPANVVSVSASFLEAQAVSNHFLSKSCHWLTSCGHFSIKCLLNSFTSKQTHALPVSPDSFWIPVSCHTKCMANLYSLGSDKMCVCYLWKDHFAKFCYAWEDGIQLFWISGPHLSSSLMVCHIGNSEFLFLDCLKIGENVPQKLFSLHYLCTLPTFHIGK